MRRDNRLSRVLHVLIHMDQHKERLTSESIARMLGTNAVVVRRTMGDLKRQGYVASEMGHGGGWELATDIHAVTALDIYKAIGEPALFAIGPASDNSECHVERVVDLLLVETLQKAETLILEQLSSLTIADLIARCHNDITIPIGSDTGEGVR